MFMPKKLLEEKLKQILSEDVGQGDITAAVVIPPNLTVQAEVIAKQDGIAAGIEEATVLSECLGLKVKANVSDGQEIRNRQVLMNLSGDAQTILSIERTLLNVVSRMSGIATQTRMLTEKLREGKVKAKIAATRKSAPGLLYFDKKAVFIGGGDPHRLHLDDMLLIKDNHLAIVGNVEEAVKQAKANASFAKKIEVEVTKAENALKAAKAGADVIMLDNFNPEKAKATSEALKKAGFSGVLLEVSGGITAENLLEYAKAEVNIISMGELTHSAKAFNVSLEVIKKSLNS